MNADFIRDLWRKKRMLESGDIEHQAIKTVLLILGGGMRGAYQAGMTIALNQLGLVEVFDFIVGVSTGALVGAYALAGLEQNTIGASLYFEEGTTRQFTDLRRFKVFDSKYLEQVIRCEKPLDHKAARSARSEFWVGVTNFRTGAGELINAKIASPDLIAAVVASTSFYDQPKVVNGGQYVDGDLALPLPISQVIQKFCPTHILVLANTPGQIACLNTRLQRLAVWAFLRRNVALREAWRGQNEEIESGLQSIRDSQINIGIVMPSQLKITQITQNCELLRKAVAECQNLLLNQLGEPPG